MWQALLTAQAMFQLTTIGKAVYQVKGPRPMYCGKDSKLVSAVQALN